MVECYLVEAVFHRLASRFPYRYLEPIRPSKPKVRAKIDDFGKGKGDVIPLDDFDNGDFHPGERVLDEGYILLSELKPGISDMLELNLHDSNLPEVWPKEEAVRLGEAGLGFSSFIIYVPRCGYVPRTMLPLQMLVYLGFIFNSPTPLPREPFPSC